MGFDLGSSQSETRSRTSTIGQATVSGTGVVGLQGDRSVSATQGGVVLGRGASLGSTIIKAGKGATVTIGDNDGAAIQQAQQALESLIRGQADNTAAALTSLGNISDGNQVAPGLLESPTPWIAAAGGFLLLIALLWFLKRR